MKKYRILTQEESQILRNSNNSKNHNQEVATTIKSSINKLMSPPPLSNEDKSEEFKNKISKCSKTTNYLLIGCKERTFKAISMSSKASWEGRISEANPMKKHKIFLQNKIHQDCIKKYSSNTTWHKILPPNIENNKANNKNLTSWSISVV